MFDYYTHNICQVKESVNLRLENIACSLQTFLCYASQTFPGHAPTLFLQYRGFFGGGKDIQGCSHSWNSYSFYGAIAFEIITHTHELTDMGCSCASPLLFPHVIIHKSRRPTEKASVSVSTKQNKKNQNTDILS